METSTEVFNGTSALNAADTLVIKIGGDHAGNIIWNIRNAEERLHAGKKVALVLSAFRQPRGGTFNTTSELIKAAQSLAHDEPEEACKQIDGVADFAQEVFAGEAYSLNGPQRNSFVDALMETLRNEIRDLKIHLTSAQPKNVRKVGEDYVVTNGDTLSLSGWGEHLVSTIYARASVLLGVPGKELPARSIAAATYREHGYEPDRRIDTITMLRSRVASAILECRKQSSLLFAPGHFPTLASERGYSDTGAALVAQAMAMGMIRNSAFDVVCLIRKLYPMCDRDPSSGGPRKIERYLRFSDALARVQPRGSAAGLIHQAGLQMLEERRIPTVISDPKGERDGNNTLII